MVVQKAPGSLREDVVRRHARRRNLAGTGTFFRDVERLPPGEIAVFSPEGERRRRYWTLPMPVSLRKAAGW